MNECDAAHNLIIELVHLLHECRVQTGRVRPRVKLIARARLFSSADRCQISLIQQQLKSQPFPLSTTVLPLVLPVFVFSVLFLGDLITGLLSTFRSPAVLIRQSPKSLVISATTTTTTTTTTASTTQFGLIIEFLYDILQKQLFDGEEAAGNVHRRGVGEVSEG